MALDLDEHNAGCCEKMRRVKSEFNGGGSRASFGHHDPDENNFNGSSYITRLSYSLFRSSLALDRSTMVGKTLRRGEANLGGKKKKKKKKKVGNRAMRRGRRERERERKRERRRERERRARGSLLFRWPRQTPNWQRRVGGCYAVHTRRTHGSYCVPPS